MKNLIELYSWIVVPSILMLLVGIIVGYQYIKAKNELKNEKTIVTFKTTPK